MAVAVIGGLVFSIFITLAVLPCMMESRSWRGPK